MAAGLGQLALRKTGQEISSKYSLKYLYRQYALKSQPRIKGKGTLSKKVEYRFDSMANSLAAKGFLRSTKSYSPPDNVSEKVKSIFTTLKLPIKAGSSYTFTNLEEKFKVLEACFKDFKHTIPNSELYEINTMDDVIQFYKTPVNTIVPLDAMKNIELPKNLHIQYEYKRFNPQTDTMFNGQTAFPKSSTLVTGLKYRDKYPGHIAKRSWP